jgi:6-phosphofructokinase
MPSLKGNALVGQSGGPTCVINQSLVGIVEACLASEHVGSVYGAIHGIRGVLDENLIDLGRETAETLEAVAATPCAGLRSVRQKPTREDCEAVLRVLKAHDVRYFFYIGGNDSAETANLLNEVAVADGYEVRLFHVPKTIDNDLRVTDHCPGFGSAARFVAQALMGDDQDNRSLPGIKIDVIMGRDAGWLTASSVLARTYEGSGPHLIYLPETAFSMEGFLADVEGAYNITRESANRSQDAKRLVDTAEGFVTASEKNRREAQTMVEDNLGDFDEQFKANEEALESLNGQVCSLAFWYQ